jgi:hypothetical protein
MPLPNVSMIYVRELSSVRQLGELIHGDAGFLRELAELIGRIDRVLDHHAQARHEIPANAAGHHALEAIEVTLCLGDAALERSNAAEN